MMKHIAQEDFAERIPVNQQDFDSTFGLSYQPPVGLSHEKRLSHSDGRLEKTKKAEMVVWILVVLLAFVTAAAFYVLWLRLGGTEERIRFRVGAPPSLSNTCAAHERQGSIAEV